MSDEEVLDFADILATTNLKPAFIKCRLIHLNQMSVVQPDIIFVDNYRRDFFVPRFFDPNNIAFFDDDRSNFCRFTIVVYKNVTLKIGFFMRDRIKNCTDGSIIYKCMFATLGDATIPKPSGIWRKRGDAFQIKLFHHTNDVGFMGIRSSQSIWSSRRNIQGNLLLNNVSYGYFTNIEKIKNESDLLEVAMSSSGLTGLIPTNAPYHPLYAKMVKVPQQTAVQRSKSLYFWINCEFVAPNHLWIHRPMDRPAYYEVVLPKVFRVGVQPGTNLRIKGDEIQIDVKHRKIFQYVIVGDADTPDGLHAPYHEEETTSVAVVEPLGPTGDIISFWKQKANSDQFYGRTIEYAQLKPDTSSA